MNFTTKIPISPVAEDNQLSYATPVVSMGSCFAAHMQEKFAYYKLPFFSHPFGTLFHPLAIERSLERACLGQLFTEEDFFLEEDLWLSFDLHSQWANPSLPTLLEHLNQEVKEVGEALSKASFLILTLGTAWVYEHLTTGNIVANCHKQPQKIFSKQLLSAQQIQASLEHIVALVRERQPQIKVIFTLSPVRHLRDGAVENQLSKSLLLCAIHALLGTCTSQKAEGLFYFPSYEILMDELRDYRFYKEDMLHPTEQAVQHGAGLGDIHFSQADEDGDGDDKADGAQVGDAERGKQIGIEQVGADGGECEDESGGKAHAEGSIDFARDAHEGAEAEELREDEVVHQNGAQHDVEVAVHGVWRQ